jgi:hypothetical protein
MSQTKFCSCGKALSRFGGVRLLLCRTCRDRREQEKKEHKRIQKQQEAMRIAKELGKSLVHSCLSNPCDPEQPCACRRFVSAEEARRMVEEEGAVHFKLRTAYFLQGEPILLVNKRLRAPRASTIEAAHMQRGVERSHHRSPDELKAQCELLQTRLNQERIDKDLEERLRWECWAELERDFYASLTVMVSDEEWHRSEQASRAVPVMPLAPGVDLRSSVGVDIARPMAFAEKVAA